LYFIICVRLPQQYLIVVSVSNSASAMSSDWIVMNSEQERTGRKAVMDYLGNCPEGPRRTTKNLSTDNRYHCQESIWASIEYM
jgi:hypothetical protein